MRRGHWLFSCGEQRPVGANVVDKLSLFPQANRLGQTPAEVLTRQQLEVSA